MVPLGRVRDAAPGEEHPPQEGRPAALLLQQSEVDVQGQVLLRAEAQQVHDPAELAAVCDLEHQLAALPLLRQPVEPQAEGPVKQLGKPGSQSGVPGDDPHLACAEGVAVQQDAVGLRPGAAQLLHRQAAQLVFGFKGKGHGWVSSNSG